KNVEFLCLEWGETLPNDFLSHSLAVLPKLKHLHLIKFSISATLMSLIASKRQLETLAVWPNFHDQNAKQSWRNLVDGLAKQKFIQIFTLGIGSQNLSILKDETGEKIITQK
uniref:Uncharacterized protein n=1 Tax=Romanomermis culicivorax TaxID=13658 RepID=A0A915L6W8_ROMCU